MRKPKLLIVEDDLGLLNTLCDVLEMQGYLVNSASNGLSGLNQAKRIQPELILTDVSMPKMNGLEMATSIRSDKNLRLIPIIFLSGNVSESDRIKGLTIGANDYITKPFSMAELLIKVKNSINIREQLLKQFHQEPIGKTIDSDEVAFLTNLQKVLMKNIENKQLQLADLAKEVAVSDSTLQKKLKRIAGKSVSQYVREFRLEYANKLIVAGSRNLGEVSEKSGFTSLSYFTRTYKSYFGYTPSETFDLNK